MTRTLPIRVTPIPGEALESWLAAYGSRMACTWGDLLESVIPGRLGLQSAADSRGRPPLTTGLTHDERNALSEATGVSPCDLDAMTLTGQYGPPIIVPTPMRRSSTPWGQIYRQRYCPSCMKDTPGRHMLEWQLPWITSCARHHCLLNDECPKCRQLQVVAPVWFRRITNPDAQRCHGLLHGGLETGRCRALLSAAAVLKIGDLIHPVLEAQQTLQKLLTGDEITEGVYAAAPVDAAQLLLDIRALGNWILRTSTPTDLMTLLGSGCKQRTNAWRRIMRKYPAAMKGSVRSWLNTSAPAPVVSVGIAAAMSILLSPTFAAAGEAMHTVTGGRLDIRYPSHRARGNSHSVAVTAVQIMSHAHRFNVLEHLSFRTMCPLPRVPAPRRSTCEDPMLRATPTLMWPDIAFALDTGHFAFEYLRKLLSRLLLTIGSMAVNRDVERLLGSTTNRERTLHAAYQLSSGPHWTNIVAALLRIRDYLESNAPPIDYQRRRQLRYDTLLLPEQWHDLLTSHGLGTIPGTAIAARLWLTERVSAAPVHNIFSVEPMRGVNTDRFRSALTPELLASLDTVSLDFLASQGIRDEPVSWQPTDLFDGIPLPGAVTAPDFALIHRLMDARLTLPEVAEKLHVSVWKVRLQIERHPHPAGSKRRRWPVRGPKQVPHGLLDRAMNALSEATFRQLYERERYTIPEIADVLDLGPDSIYAYRVIAKLARRYGIAYRSDPTEVITEEWIREQHIGKRRPFTDLAREVGVDSHTIGDWAHKHGIENQHVWTLPDPRMVKLLDTLSLGRQSLPASASTATTLRRIQRFAAVVNYPNYTVAAADMGCSPSAISAQVRKLEHNLEHKLVEHELRKPMRLTAFGAQLISEARRLAVVPATQAKRIHGASTVRDRTVGDRRSIP